MSARRRLPQQELRELVDVAGPRELREREVALARGRARLPHRARQAGGQRARAAPPPGATGRRLRRTNLAARYASESGRALTGWWPR